MARIGFIPDGSVARYEREARQIVASRDRAPEVAFWKMSVNEAPYAMEAVRRELEKRFEKDRIVKGGLRVRTTFDLDAQRAAQDALRAGLSALHKEFGKPKGPPLQGGLAAIRPSDGAILALVGGTGFNFQNQLDRAAGIRRPVGSTVKPFVYAAAFGSGAFHPGDKIVDEPVTYRSGGKTWSPKNYDRKYRGEVTLERAVHQSINTVAIRVLEKTGVGEVIDLLAKASGAPKERFPRNLTLALGTFDLSPLEVARAYGAFADRGRSREPYFIRAVEDREGGVLEAGGPKGEPVSALDAVVASTVTAVLRGVLGAEGSAHGAALRTGFTVPAAGKTGTTDEYRDAWFAGFTGDLAAAVWIGFDDMRVSLGPGGTGGRVAAPIWMSFVKEFYRNRPTRPLPDEPTAPPEPAAPPAPGAEASPAQVAPPAEPAAPAAEPAPTEQAPAAAAAASAAEPAAPGPEAPAASAAPAGGQ